MFSVKLQVFLFQYRDICPHENFTAKNIKKCNEQELSLNEDYQLYIIIALWSLLVLSLVEGILERIKKFPTPFEKFQETNEEVVDPELPIERLFQNATENQLYDHPPNSTPLHGVESSSCENP